MPAPPMSVAAWLRWDAIRRHLDGVGPRTVLEIGAGRGATGHRIAQRCAYLGVEPDDRSRADAERALAGARGAEVRAEGIAAVGVGERFDLVCAFEVLEHVDDDVAELRRWVRHLEPGGHLLLSVPAHARRFGPTDRAVGHVRRYDRDVLVERLRAADLDVVALEPYGAGLGHLLERGRDAIVRRRARRASPGDIAEGTAGSGRFLQPRSVVQGVATATAAAPFRVLQRAFARTEVGIGWVVLARPR